jgi:hypothetical protein
MIHQPYYPAVLSAAMNGFLESFFPERSFTFKPISVVHLSYFGTGTSSKHITIDPGLAV